MLLVLLAACSGTGTGSSTTTSILPTSTAPPPAVTSTTADSATTTQGPSTTTPDPGTTTTTVRPIDITIESGETSGLDLIKVTLGDTVEVMILSDAPGEVHVHGYDLFFELEADTPLLVSFLADVPGVFEVELEGSHLLLFDLEVTG